MNHLFHLDIHGSIVVITVPPGDLVPPEGLDPDTGLYILPWEDLIEDLPHFYENHYWDYSTRMFVEKPPRPNNHARWENAQWVWEDSEVLQQIRNERTKRLLVTDWTQVPDVALSSEEVQEYRTYRQALRDITNNLDLTIVHKPEDVDWPTKPGG